jgi:hypothetical protein
MAQIKGRRQEFRVVFTGVDLPKEHQERLNVALQQATMQVLADLDFGGDRAAVAIPLKGNGGTQGIWISELPRGDLEGLLGGGIG